MTVWHNPRLLRWLASWLMLAGLCLLVIGAARWVISRPFFNITKIEVQAVAGAPLVQIDATLLTTVQLGELKGGLFGADLNRVKRSFESMAWVRKANVRRIWPNRLQVEIEEHRALALWDDGRIVNTFGDLFSANSAALDNESDLAMLSGPPGSHNEVTRRWQELNEWLQPLGRSVSELTLSDRHAWQVDLDNGLVLLLGRDQGTQIKDRVQRMVRVLPEVNQRLGRAVTQIDLRHPEGFAVRAPKLEKVSDGVSGEPTSSKVTPRVNAKPEVKQKVENEKSNEVSIREQG